MNGSYEAERTIDIKDLIYRCLKNWRRIVIGAIAVALLAALFQIYSELRVLLNEENLSKAQEKYEISVQDYQATGERIQKSIENLRSQSANQQVYNEKSELMKIDPMNKWVGNFQLYIDSKYQIDPNLTYQNPDLTNRLVAAYASYLESGDLYNALLDEIDTVNEIRFLREIYSVESSPGTATITVRAVGKTEADVKKILDAVKRRITEHAGTLQDAIGEHENRILMESLYSTIDLELDAIQKDNLLLVSEYANAIGEKDKELSLWTKTPMPKMTFGIRYTIRQAVKFLILGGIIGVVLMLLWNAIRYITSNTIKTEDDWKQFGLPILGSIKQYEKKSRFQRVDRLIERIFGRDADSTMEKDCVLTAKNLKAALLQNGLKEAVFVGPVDSALAGTIMRLTQAAVPGTRFIFAGDALAQPETAENLENEEKVILLAMYRTRMADIQRTLSLLKAWGKDTIGVVVLDSTSKA